MESGNLLAIISKLISFNKEEKELNHLSQLNNSIAKMVVPNFEAVDSIREGYVIPVTRQLALEQIRNIN